MHLLATESTGALSRPVILLLKTLAKATQGTAGHDSTQYGLGRASRHRIPDPPQFTQFPQGPIGA